MVLYKQYQAFWHLNHPDIQLVCVFVCFSFCKLNFLMHDKYSFYKIKQTRPSNLSILYLEGCFFFLKSFDSLIYFPSNFTTRNSSHSSSNTIRIAKRCFLKFLNYQTRRAQLCLFCKIHSLNQLGSRAAFYSSIFHKNNCNDIFYFNKYFPVLY